LLDVGCGAKSDVKWNIAERSPLQFRHGAACSL
jgi:hypothetical protein